MRRPGAQHTLKGYNEGLRRRFQEKKCSEAVTGCQLCVITTGNAKICRHHCETPSSRTCGHSGPLVAPPEHHALSLLDFRSETTTGRTIPGLRLSNTTSALLLICRRCACCSFCRLSEVDVLTLSPSTSSQSFDQKAVLRPCANTATPTIIFFLVVIMRTLHAETPATAASRWCQSG